MSHTPGPWERNISPKYPVYAGPKGKHTLVAAILSPAEHAAADYALIAAAPELLAAAERALIVLDGLCSVRGENDAMAQLEAAIAKTRS